MTGPRHCNGVSVSFTLLIVGIMIAFEVDALETHGRYSLVEPGPTVVQRDLLAAPVSLRLSDSVRTVGQAVEAALLPTGYRLASALSADPERAPLLALPLPMAHRALDNIPVRHALEILVGPAFRVIEDPVHRLVSFERCGQTSGSVGQPRQTPSW